MQQPTQEKQILSPINLVISGRMCVLCLMRPVFRCKTGKKSIAKITFVKILESRKKQRLREESRGKSLSEVNCWVILFQKHRCFGRAETGMWLRQEDATERTETSELLVVTYNRSELENQTQASFPPWNICSARG